MRKKEVAESAPLVRSSVKVGGDTIRRIRVFSPHRIVYIFAIFVCFDILLKAKSMPGVSDNPLLANVGQIFGLFKKISKI